MRKLIGQSLTAFMLTGLLANAWGGEFHCQKAYEKKTNARTRLSENLHQLFGVMNGPAAYGALALLLVAPTPAFALFFGRDLAIAGMNMADQSLESIMLAQSLIEEAIESRDVILDTADSLAELEVNSILQSPDDDMVEQQAREAVALQKTFNREEFESPLEKMIKSKDLPGDYAQLVLTIQGLAQSDAFCPRGRAMELHALLKTIRKASR